MPPKYKKGGANNRDRRHENGLAPPAKQIKKQGSDGLLNGHADNNKTTPDLPVTADDPYSLPARPDSDQHHHSRRLSDPDTDPMAPDHAAVLAALDSHHSAGSNPARDTMADFPSLDSHPAALADVAAHVSLDRTFPFVQNAATVIAPLSIVDIVAILMVLMQLPSSVLTLVNTVFAFLTFGAPPAGWSTSTVASASEWLQSHGGNPSFVTMIFLDVIFLGLWSLAPSWAKDMFLDFSQAVVAISLGGCSTGIHAKFNGLISIGVICIYHLLGIDTAWRNIPLRIVTYAISLLTSQTQLGSLEYRDVLDAFDVSPDSGRSWPRILLEIHIVTQGIVRVLRRSLARTSVPRPSGKKTASSDPNVNETPTDGARNTSSDGRQPGPSPAARDAKERLVSSGKKKRKQATFVRSQQPFWAAIASTKVTVSKEIEQSQSSRDSFEAGASSASQLGSSSNNCLDDSVWVSDIHDTEIRFSAVFFSVTKGQPGASACEDSASAADSTLTIRVNGAEWTQISVVCGGQRDGKSVLTGKIFGLTPLTNYRVEFDRSRDGAPLHSVNLLTRPPPSLEEVQVAAPIEGSFRPSSPMSTLRKSINAAQASLADHRNRSKKTRKDHKSATNALRREVDIIENRLSSWSGNDERQRQRQIQFRQNIKQAEDSFETVTEEIEHLGDIPEDERAAAAEGRARFKEQERALDATRADVDAARASRERHLAVAKAETTQQQQKHDRLAARLAKLHAQREGLVAAAAQDSRFQQQRDLSRLAELQARVDVERSYAGNIARLTGERDALVAQHARLEQHLALLESHAFAPADPATRTPESPFATPAYPRASAAPSTAFNQPLATSRRGSLMGAKPSRGRSSSMLSNVSAFTDDEIQPSGGGPNGVRHAHADANVNGDGGGGGGGDSGSASNGSGRDEGSRPATTSPAPVPRLSPIGAGRASPRGASAGLGLGVGR